MSPHPFFQAKLAKVHTDELMDQAERDRAARAGVDRPEGRFAALWRRLSRGRAPRPARPPEPGDGDIRIRYASVGDQRSLERLVSRAGSRPPQPPVLVADVEDRLVVAKSMTDGLLIVDPACSDPGVGELVGLRASQLGAGDRSSAPR